MKRCLLIFCFLCLGAAQTAMADSITVRDMAGRDVTVAAPPKRIVCLAPGTLRLIIYLGAKEMVAGVEAIEKRFPTTRPYWVANSDLKKRPSVGPGGPGSINSEPDLEALLSAAPDLIFITYLEKRKADQLQAKLGIPVVVLSYGPFGRFDETMYRSLRLAGKVLAKEKRADEVVAFIENAKKDLSKRVESEGTGEKPGVYVGGIGFKGTQGIGSTETSYAPFDWVGARNVVAGQGTNGHLFVGRETLLDLDPDILFIDGGGRGNVARDMQAKPAFYKGLSAFRKGRVYSLHSYNWYMTNIGTAMGDAYAIGKILYPHRFADIDPATKADEIYSFLVGKPVYGQMKTAYGPMGGKLSIK
ncbi:iron ABC transporter substrate-binding protein [Desulfoluna spongiiphila]|uniref:iron ABC transporter substrate-binding protein n=1 Tax=Desulfoluna spongiiphila TaxID=419481 RepID=UPI0012560460|nr:iron ABC transporter substrate-binding protein [Desulfoluna spongiiphila]VVS95590.1 abc transporter periplasmic binding domain [Desulfoluna spongiiphila]